MTNFKIIQKLQILANNSEGYRKLAFEKAITEIQKLPFNITKVSQIKDIPGIGPGISRRIQEILDTGSLKEIQNFAPTFNEKSKIIEELKTVWSIGDEKAKYLWSKGAKSINDLLEPKYYETLTENQQVALKYHNDLLSKALWQDVDFLVADFQKFADFYDLEIFPSGSYRRHKKEIGDLDLIILQKEDITFEEVIHLLLNHDLLTHIFTLGKRKMSGITRLITGQYFRIDIISMNKEELPFALLYFTGSRDFVKEQRTMVKKMGYTLNEFGLFKLKDGTKVSDDLRSEEDIFEFLNLEYVEPEDR